VREKILYQVDESSWAEPPSSNQENGVKTGYGNKSNEEERTRGSPKPFKHEGQQKKKSRFGTVREGGGK